MVELTFKTLQQTTFKIAVEPSNTVADLKAKIAESQGHPSESQKLIYAGKILADDKTVDSLAIKEKDFIVLMTTKPKAPRLAAASTSAVVAPAPTPVQAATPAPAPVVTPAPMAVDPIPAATPAPVPEAAPSTPTPAATTPAPAFGDPSSLLTGSALEEVVSNIVAMGFERAEVLRAMRASFNNPDRAVEYLTTGIPAHLAAQAVDAPPAARPPSAVAPAPVPRAQVPAQPSAPAAAAPAQPTPAAAAPARSANLFQLAQQQQQQQQQSQFAGAGGIPGAGAGAGAGALGGALGQSELASQFRELAAQNPAILQNLIQRAAGGNPALAGLAPEQLLEMFLNAAGAEEGDAPPPGAEVIHVTPEERAAIERLESLGFAREVVIEAYFACDKNEEMAANYLFEHGNDDEE